MKKVLFVALGVLFALAMYAAPPTDVGKPLSDQVLLVQAEAQPMVADFVYVDYSIETIATASETSYELYVAMPAEVRNQVFDLKMPVFRLCNRSYVAMNSQITIQELARRNLPPNRKALARKSLDTPYEVG